MSFLFLDIHIIQLNYNWKGHWNTRINNIYYGTDTWESRTPNRHVLRIIYHPSITHVIKHFTKDKKTNIFVRKTWKIGNTFFPKGKLYWYITNQVIFTCYIELSSEQNLSFVDFDNNMETKAQIWYYVSDLHNMWSLIKFYITQLLGMLSEEKISWSLKFSYINRSPKVF